MNAGAVILNRLVLTSGILSLSVGPLIIPSVHKQKREEVTG